MIRRRLASLVRFVFASFTIASLHFDDDAARAFSSEVDTGSRQQNAIAAFVGDGSALLRLVQHGNLSLEIWSAVDAE
jgi:hypothetical protein